MTYITKQKTEKGFIALMSAIIISAILLLVVSASNFSGFYGRSNVLESELKEQSVALAEACATTALIKMASDKLYNPLNEIQNVGIGNCTIKNISTVGNRKIITVESDYKNALTKINIKVDPINAQVESWEEVAVSD